MGMQWPPTSGPAANTPPTELSIVAVSVSTTGQEDVKNRAEYDDASDPVLLYSADESFAAPQHEIMTVDAFSARM